MLEKFLRSPFVMMMILIMVGLVFVGSEEGWPVSMLFIPYFLFFVIYYLLIVIHNKQHPNRKIKLITFSPYELREEDEGLQYMTFKAMRNVYIFYSLAIPFGLSFIFLFQDVIPYLSMWLLVGFGVIQYLIYWLGIRKAFKEED